MMSLHSYLLFMAASFALALAPGPDMMYMLGRSIAQGRRAGILSAIGFNLGGYVHLTAAVLGLSAILATSALAFTIVKWIGAAYLLYLGISILWSKQGPLIIIGQQMGARHGRTILWQAFLSDVLNPKVALFFVALLPQFVDRNAARPTLQILVLGTTLNMICLPINICLACCSSWIARAVRRSQLVSRWLHKALGALFVALGLRIAIEKI